MQGDITVPLLTIEPGVVVCVDTDKRIEVTGAILADGTASQPITFTSANPPSRWKGIRFQDVALGSVLRHCVIELANDSGLQVVDSQPTVEYCVIRNNTSNAKGGGVRITMTTGDFTLYKCEIMDNTSNTDHGGGVHAVTGSGQLIMKRCVVSGNSTSTAGGFHDLVGGGIRISGNSHLTDCEIKNNKTNGYQTGSPLSRGGGIYTNGGTALWERCVIVGNTAETRSANCSCNATYSHGGGVYMDSGTLTATNCIVGGNRLVVTKGTTTFHSAGGVYVNGGTALFENCVLSRNDRQGLTCVGGSVDVRNSILWENGGPAYSGPMTIEHSCVQGGSPGTGNIAFNPVFAGTGTQACDFQVVIPSPCIDAGDPSPAYNDACLPPGEGTVRNDMGAFGGPQNCGWLPPVGGSQTYCVAKTDSVGCTPQVSTVGTASISMPSGFTIMATGVQGQRTGMLFYGISGCANIPFKGGILCVLPPNKRTVPQFSSGTPSQCDGMFALSLDKLTQVANPIVMQGSLVQSQFWYRDPADPFMIGLSDAVEFLVGP